MKIGILTQPLHTNYGGLLQNYALQTVLKRIGHDVWTIDTPLPQPSNFKKIELIAKRVVLRLFFRRKDITPIMPVQLALEERIYINRNLQEFITVYIQRTETIKSRKQLSLLDKYNFESYVVGSDQVWRYGSLDVPVFFLNFVSNRNDLVKIAYAASFGKDEWRYPRKLTKLSSSLIKKFNAVSVREDSAVILCKEFLKVDAVQVLDPTMLLDKKDYLEIAQKDTCNFERRKIVTYMLDNTEEKQEIVKKISSYYGIEAYNILPNRNYNDKNFLLNKDDYTFVSVSKWIRSFEQANFIITDSFHGTVFSILFNKPFVVIGNCNRGMTRFSSLLKLFNLEERLIHSLKDLNLSLLDLDIDYTLVNNILEREKKKSMNFLLNAFSIINNTNGKSY